jgi:hypothetical protein
VAAAVTVCTCSRRTLHVAVPACALMCKE